MTIAVEHLNENQREAVLWNDGPMLVLAGPGSGKTRVLTLRVARLVEETEEVSVLALTFTNAAAAEMRERVDALLGRRADRAHLCTFHSFAADVLRQHGSHLGIHPGFGLLTQDQDRFAIIEPIFERLREQGYLLPTDHKNLLSLVDRMFADSYDGSPDGLPVVRAAPWLQPLFLDYCRAMVAANRLDFGALLHFTRELLQTKPAVTRVLRLAWTHVCVDEFQDTNKAQYDLLRLLVATKKPNLFVVADDDQIIYQWNGASPERLQSLRTDYEMAVVQLPQNYRCPPEVIGLANRLIVHNLQRTPEKKPLAAIRPPSLSDGVIRYAVFNTPDEEAAGVAKDIGDRHLVPADCVVLARATRHLEAAAAALAANGLAAHIVQRKNEFTAPVVQLVFSALRLANGRHDRDVLRRLCVAWGELTDSALDTEDVAAASSLLGGDFLRAWGDAAKKSVPGTDAQALATRIFSSMVDHVEFPHFVEWFLAEGWSPWRSDEDVEVEVNTWQALHNEIVREHGQAGLTLNTYLHQMDLASKAPSTPPNAIRCMTIHGAKGLEFKHVYLIGLAQEVFPSYQAVKKGLSSREVEEERRNCFVAITRVQATLTLTRARNYYGYSKAPSQFLEEMGIDDSDREKV